MNFENIDGILIKVDPIIESVAKSWSNFSLGFSTYITNVLLRILLMLIWKWNSILGFHLTIFVKKKKWPFGFVPRLLGLFNLRVMHRLLTKQFCDLLLNKMYTGLLWICQNIMTFTFRDAKVVIQYRRQGQIIIWGEMVISCVVCLKHILSIIIFIVNCLINHESYCNIFLYTYVA